MEDSDIFRRDSIIVTNYAWTFISNYRSQNVFLPYFGMDIS
jgi:hypothetical protein